MNQLEAYDILEDIPYTTMIRVPGETFIMGDDEGNSREKPAHLVRLDSFQMGQYPVTQELWEAVMGTNPSYFKGPYRPVERVSWKDTQKFLYKLNEQLGLFGDKKYRLPTEAEWEYAARGGGVGTFGRISPKYSGSNHLDYVGWYSKNSQNQTHAVGLKAPNALGLYDMSGNVREWCQDAFDENYYQTCSDQGTVSNPQGPESGRNRVLRGGSWDGLAVLCRVAYRDNFHPDYRSYFIGLRLSRTV